RSKQPLEVTRTSAPALRAALFNTRTSSSDPCSAHEPFLLPSGRRFVHTQTLRLGWNIEFEVTRCLRDGKAGRGRTKRRESIQQRTKSVPRAVHQGDELTGRQQARREIDRLRRRANATGC